MTTHRWNFEQRDDGLYFCDGEHPKFEGCQFELVTEEVFRSTTSRARKEALEEAAQRLELMEKDVDEGEWSKHLAEQAKNGWRHACSEGAAAVRELKKG